MRCESCGADAAADDAEIARLKALITELADALKVHSVREPVINELIQRAREAAK